MSPSLGAGIILKWVSEGGGIKRLGRYRDIGFSRLFLIALVAILTAGAAFIWYSVGTHPQIRSQVAVLNSRKPMNVLVGVQGTPLNPGFVGFVAEVRPNSQILQVVPISGRRPVHYNGSSHPLYEAVSEVTPNQAMHLVADSTRIPIDHYFYIDATNLYNLLDALYYHSPHWPTHETPLTMLKILGYPGNSIHSQREMELVREMLNRLPLVSPLAAASLLSIPRTSLTNLSRHQLFLLANYVRGDALKSGTLPGHRSHRRIHG